MLIHKKNKLILIGNDIMALNSAANIKSFSNKRYLEKIFGEKELSFLNENNHPNLPQIFWTIKESAYKTMVKLGCRNTFCPITLEINTKRILLNCEMETSIKYKDHLIIVRTFHTSNYIHSVAATNPQELKSVNYRVIKISPENTGSQGRLIRQLFVYDYALEQSVCIDNVSIRSNHLTYIPSVFYNGLNCNVDLSLSHDDIYIAYAYSGSLQ